MISGVLEYRFYGEGKHELRARFRSQVFVIAVHISALALAICIGVPWLLMPFVVVRVAAFDGCTTQHRKMVLVMLNNR
jgi:hypothetical protein